MADFTVFIEGSLVENQKAPSSHKATKITTAHSSTTGEAYHCLQFSSIENVRVTLHSITVEDLKVLKGVIDEFLSNCQG